MEKNKLLTSILVINLIIIILFSLFPNKVFAATQTVTNQINKIDNKKYPGIKSMVQKLQKQHPNWKFKVMYTGLKWNDVIAGESKHGRNLIGKNIKRFSGDWICKTCENKGYSGGNWVCVSSEAIAYMMDPRNSLNYADIFQFLELSYDEKAKYDTNIIKKILNNTFLDDGKLDEHIKTIMNRCKEKNVNPYYIAVKAIQEQGPKGSSTFKMKENDKSKVYYYNIFNINATGKTKSAIIANALSYAKDKGWTTVDKCIIGGVDFIANGYINQGQDTMYFEKFDVIADSYYTHQYAQDVYYAQGQGEKLLSILESIDATELPYTFVIPLYEKMPSKACERPSTTSTNTTTDNTSYVKGDVNNDGKVSSSDYVLIKNHIMGTKTLSEENKKYADYNGDGKITSSDYVLIKNYIMNN